MGNASENEKAKITANFLNSLAAGVVVTGYIAPVWGLFNGSISGSGVSIVLLAASVLGAALHMTARHYAGRVGD